MSEVAVDPFEEMVRAADEGWLVDWCVPSSNAIPHLLDILHRADEAARGRFGESAPSLTPDALIRAYQENPHKVRAFLQVVGSVASPDILVMVWRILEGMAISKMTLSYAADGNFQLSIGLAPAYDKIATEHYESNDIDDAVILRHLGILKIGNQGTFDGFYALNVRR